jgi:cell division initiation protein
MLNVKMFAIKPLTRLLDLATDGWCRCISFRCGRFHAAAAGQQCGSGKENRGIGRQTDRIPRRDEESLRMALLGAQKLGDSVIRESKTKAEIIMREATIKSEAMVENAKRKIELEQENLEKLQEEVASFKNRLLNLYKQHLEIISTLPGKSDAAPLTTEEKQDTAKANQTEEASSENATAKPSPEPPNFFGDSLDDEKSDSQLEDEVVDTLDEYEKNDSTQSRFSDMRFGEPFISRFTPEKKN